MKKDVHGGGLVSCLTEYGCLNEIKLLKLALCAISVKYLVLAFSCQVDFGVFLRTQVTCCIE